VAMPAKHIVAQPGTITGSIGVLAGKLVTRDAWARIGVHWDEVQTHENAGMWSDTSEFSPDQSEKLKEMMDRIYADFTQRVGEGRTLSDAEVDARARGRIFTGVQAKELGLVDHLGGLAFALDLAHKEANLPDGKDAPIRVFPAEPSLLEKLTRKPASEPLEIQLSALAQNKKFAPLVRAMRMLQKHEHPVTLEMPHAEVWSEL